MALRKQVLAIIESCEKVLDTVGKGKDAKEHVDAPTVGLANKMIQQAQAENKDDAVLGAVNLGENWVTWTTLLAAMRTVYNSLPEDKPKI